MPQRRNSMTIYEKLNEELKKVMKEGNRQAIDAIKSAKAKVVEKSVEGKGRVEIDDNICIAGIENYIKQLQKAIEEFKQREDEAIEIINKYNFEINYLSKFIPQKLGKEETEILIDSAIKEAGAFSSQHIGKVMRILMKSHKEKLDPILTKRIVEEKLQGK